MKKFRILLTYTLLILNLFLIVACGEDENKEVGTSTQTLTFSIPENYLKPNEDVWVFITNSKGELLGVQQGDDNTQLTFELGEFPNNGTLILHQLNFESEAPYSSTQIVSYTGIEPGNYTLKSSLRSSPDAAGSHKITIQNMLSSYNQMWAPSPGLISAISFTPGGGTKTMDVAMLENPTNQFYKLSNATDRAVVHKYIQRDNVAFNDEITVDFSEMSSMDIQTLMFSKSFQTISLSVQMFTDETKDQILSIDSYVSANKNNLTIYYPGDESEYFTGITLSDDNRYFSYGKIGAYVSSIKTLTADITALTFSDNEIEISTTGTFDYLQIISSEAWPAETNDHDLTWSIIASKKATSRFIIPQLPAEIISMHPVLANAVIKFDAANVEDLVGIGGYGDYISRLLQSDESMYKFYTERIKLGVQF
jgi:hypothetical protein